MTQSEYAALRVKAANNALRRIALAKALEVYIAAKNRAASARDAHDVAILAEEEAYRAIYDETESL